MTERYMTHRSATRVFYIAADVLFLIIALFIGNCIRYHYEDAARFWSGLLPFLLYPRTLFIGSLTVLGWIALITIAGFYNKPERKGRVEVFLNTLFTSLVGCTLQYLFVVTNDHFADVQRLLPLFFLLLLVYFLSLYIGRFIVTWGIKRYNKDPRHYPKVLVLGSAEGCKLFVESSTAMQLCVEQSIDIEEYINNPQDEEVKKALLGAVDDCLKQHAIRAIYLATQPEGAWAGIGLLYHLFRYKKDIYITASSLSTIAGEVHLSNFHPIPLVNVADTHMSELDKNIKWVSDKICSLLAIVLLSPIMAFIAVAVKRSSKGPILYKQERIGLHGKPFMIYKFRTMKMHSEENGPQLSSHDDPRITEVGKFLRKYRLDELPQFLNVLKGDMSLVGPRPERAYYIQQIVEKAPNYYLLHNVRPGITSLGMVLFGYASNIEEMLERFQYDWIYFKNMSLLLDLKVLLYTISTLLQGKGK